jgi:TrmH family RNA methyltransferase
MKKILSRDNPAFRALLRLADSARERRETKRTLLDGVHLLQAYRDVHGMDGVQVIARASHADRAEVRVGLDRCPDAIVVGDGLFDELSDVATPTGLLAAVPIPTQPAASPHKGGFDVLLDGIQDPGNLGSILRSAAAAGGTQVWLSKDCADPWSPKCLRGGMGAQFLLRVNDRMELVATAQTFPGRLIALEVGGADSVFGVDLSGSAIAFVLGSEGRGITPELAKLAHQRVRIPMAPAVESLNVGAAAAVCFFEWARQRLPASRIEGPDRPR